MPRRFIAAAALTAAALAIFAATVVSVWHFTVDDTFITCRYAQNLAHGYGPTWNPGLPPIEGYTSFLWMLILAIPHLLAPEPYAVGKALGIAFALLTAVPLWAMVAHLRDRWQVRGGPLVPALAVALYLSFHATAVHAVSGMETALALLLLTSLLHRLVVMTGQSSGRFFAGVAVLALALGLTRPEANLAALAGFAAALILLDPPARGKLLKALLLWYVVPGAIYFLWRYSYYGHLFPLPFYIKTGGQAALAGAPNVLRFLGLMGGPLLVLSLPALRRADRAFLPAAAVAVVWLLFFLKPEHLMGYDFRYLFPLMPLLMGLAALGVGVAAAGWVQWLRRRPLHAKLAGAGVLLCLAVAAVPYLSMRGHDLSSKRQAGERLQVAHVALGKRLREIGQQVPGTHVLALGDAGAVPYFSRWITIDTFGLNNPLIAVQHVRTPDAVLQPFPDVLVIVSASTEAPGFLFAWEKGLYEMARQRGMARVATYTWMPEYYLWVMAKPESAIGRELSRTDPARAR